MCIRDRLSPPRRYKLRLPVISQYGSRFPLGSGMIGSLLVTEIILHVVEPPLSLTTTSKATGVNRLVIGRRNDGVAVRLEMTGGAFADTEESARLLSPPAAMAVTALKPLT